MSVCHECAHPKALAAQSGEKTLARAEQLAAAQSELLTELGATPVPLHPRLAPTLHPAEDHAPPALPPAPLPPAEAATAVAAASTKHDGQHADAHTGAETAKTSAAVAGSGSTLQDESAERRGASDFTPGTTAVVVLACKRSEYLKQTMNSLLELNGIDKYNVIISQVSASDVVGTSAPRRFRAKHQTGIEHCMGHALKPASAAPCVEEKPAQSHREPCGRMATTRRCARSASASPCASRT
mgnify:FL=1|jgi:hypothetical protein